MTEELSKQFVKHYQALALVNLGFNKPCFGWFMGKNYDVTFGLATQENLLRDAIVAPTFSQSFEFFREEYYILLDIVEYYDEEQLPLSKNNFQKPRGYFIWDFYDDDFNEEKAIKFDTHKEAEIACLDMLIKIAQENGTAR